MEPQSYSTPSPRINTKALIITGAFLAIVILIVAWLFHVSYPSYTVTETPFDAARNSATLKGKDIYSYDGLAFTKTNVDTNEITVLSQGVKLPEPQRVYWADSRGALMTFSGSYYYTKVDEALRARGEEINEATQNYVWYFSFADSSIHLVSKTQLSNEPVAYSEADKGFYYVPDLSDVESDTFSGAVTPLHFYSIDSQKDTTVVDDLALTNFTSIQACPEIGMKVCIIARERGNQKTMRLVGVDKNNKTSVLLVADGGRIFSTNSPNLYLQADDTRKSSTAGGDAQRDEDMTYGDMTPVLHDLKTKATTKLAFTVSDEDIFPYITSSKQYYVITDSVAADGRGNTYTSAAPSTVGSVSSKAIEYTFPDGKKYDSGITNVAGFGDKTALLTTTDGPQFLFSPSSQTRKITGLNLNEIQSVVDKCKTGDTVDYFEEEKLFKVFFTDDAQFSNRVKTFSDCVVKTNKKALLGYRFYFGARDATSGRITTD